MTAGYRSLLAHWLGGVSAPSLVGLKSVSDSGAGSDALGGLAALLSVADAGHGQEPAAHPAALVPVAETGQGADAPTIRVSLTVADDLTGAVDDVSLNSIAVPGFRSLLAHWLGGVSAVALDYHLVSDSASGADEISPGSLITVDDSATAIEAWMSVYLAWTAPLSGGNPTGYYLYYGQDPDTLATEGTQIDVGLVTSYTLSGLEPGSYYAAVAAYNADGEGSLSNVVGFAITDSVVHAGVPVADAATGTDLVSILTEIVKIVSDLAAGSDAVAPNVSLQVSDTGAGADGPSVSVRFTISDSGSGTDSLSLLLALIKTVEDAATGTDATPVVRVGLRITDAGHGVMAPAIGASISIPDSGAGTDGLLATIGSVLKTLSDAGHATDGVAITVQVPMADAGHGTMAIPTIAVSLAIDDVGAGSDISALLKALADEAHGSDSLAIAVTVPIADLGSGSDALPLAKLLELLDTAHGADSILITGTGVIKNITVTFSSKKPKTTFRLKKPGADFTIN